MGAIPRIWTQQPQQACPIDWGNPITRGLRVAISNSTESVLGSAGNLSNASPTIGLNGIGVTLTITTGKVDFRSDLAVGILGDITTLVFGRYIATTANGLTAISKCPSNGGTTTPFDFGISSTGKLKIGRANTGFRAWAGSVTVGAGTDFIGVATQSSNISTSPKFYLNGKYDSVAPTNLFGGAGTGSPTEGGSLITHNRGDNITYWNGGLIYLACVWNRVLSAAEIKTISDNPWQIFSPIRRQIFVPVTVGSSATATASFSSVALNPASGSASGAAVASGSFSALNISPQTGTASTGSGATASGSFATVTLSPASATASGSATATGGLATITLSSATGAATGSAAGNASASCSFAPISISPVVAVSIGSAMAQGGFPTIGITAATGSAIGTSASGATASGSFASITLTAATGTAHLTEPGSGLESHPRFMIHASPRRFTAAALPRHYTIQRPAS